MIRTLTVAASVALLAACGGPEAAAPAVPVAPAAAVTPDRTTAPTAPSLGVVPVDMGPAEGGRAAPRAAAQAGDQPTSPGTRPPVTQPAPKQTAPGSAPRPVTQPAPPPVTQPAPKPAPKPVTPPPAAASGCNANYTPCGPMDSDVDCQGGSGNGPSSLTGPVQVTGMDVYGLDADQDGTGCD